MNFITKIISEYWAVAFTDDFALLGALWYWPLFLLVGFNMAITIVGFGLTLGFIMACVATIIAEWPVNYNNK